MEIETLRTKLEQVKEMGYVISLRRGNTGIGYTLETLLGIAENNIKLPDFGTIEVKGITLPTDEITKDFFEAQGFSHVEIIIRNIPNKRMPSKNSPTNVTGKTDETMNNEFIVIMQKQ